MQCGFREGFNAQHCLLVLVEKCDVLDKQCYAGILLTDLPKAFKYTNHELLIEKLHAYGYKAIYRTESKGLKLTLPSVTIAMLNQAYLYYYLNLTFLIFSFGICSLMISI